ncbi:NAD(P)H-binding protein [Bosea sp. (in: a-proteobacteria)]|uniref:NAD(P)H-binding protein n=1 Tax=Bosea sp. (in: a-proteobacteria) TaxID=1871050 RepID=UPI002735AADA|nr:NAD(P)H-binding protein [Bosea sp. (in: a-proteobacteria)]MDP3406738.1 NAD(P)H-binding protein [Bosea sp. (in: a-proteobacteria)]
MLGATGTIGRATLDALLRRGHEVVCFTRAPAGARGADPRPERARLPEGTAIRPVDFGDPAALATEGFAGERFDAVLSCMASRSGAPADAWAVDHRAHLNVLAAAQQAGIGHFVLLSAICVQKPLLAFQQAKLAFEAALIGSGLRYSIVRPTAFFKSLSGQIERLRQGRPFLIFGDGTLTACKPISDADLADYLVGCLDDPHRWNAILPIGGPGEAITPRQQGEALFALLGREPRFRSVPVAVLDIVIATLKLLGAVVPPLAAKAELARIGRYYATESMLVLDPATGRYDAAATPSTGTDTLVSFYRAVVNGAAAPERGDHAVF